MASKSKKILFSVLLIVIALVAVSTFFFLKKEIPGCLNLRVNNSSLTIYIPDEFKVDDSNGRIGVVSKILDSGGNPIRVLIVEPDTFNSLSQILKHLDPGPEYKEGAFQDMKAGFVHYDVSYNEGNTDPSLKGARIPESDQYLIPFNNNENFYIYFSPYDLPENLRDKATQMIKSIKLDTIKKNEPRPSVETCKWIDRI